MICSSSSALACLPLPGSRPWCNSGVSNQDKVSPFYLGSPPPSTASVRPTTTSSRARLQQQRHVCKLVSDAKLTVFVRDAVPKPRSHASIRRSCLRLPKFSASVSIFSFRQVPSSNPGSGVFSPNFLWILPDSWGPFVSDQQRSAPSPSP